MSRILKNMQQGGAQSAYTRHVGARMDEHRPACLSVGLFFTSADPRTRPCDSSQRQLASHTVQVQATPTMCTPALGVCVGQGVGHLRALSDLTSLPMFRMLSLVGEPGTVPS